MKGTAEVVIPELVDIAAEFTATVTSVHEGYSYLGSVRRGYETVATNGDVFVPMVFSVGAQVTFSELNDNPKRAGKFRTERATVIRQDLVIAGQPALAVLGQLAKRTIYHRTAKAVDPEKVEQAAENQPFAEMIPRVLASRQDSVSAADMASDFLASQFSNLESHGVNYSVREQIDESVEEGQMAKAEAEYRRLGMEGQATSIKTEYAKFRGIRRAFALMEANGLLKVESVIPMRNLADLLVTAPVWFIHSRLHGINISGDRLDDASYNPFVSFFCEQMPTKNFAWLYQIYNRRVRPMSEFSGRDIMPLPMVKIMDEAKKTFDFLVIATPYHDVASREWADPKWQRNVDPFLIGFMRDLPFMFLLGRWSQTGLFPLVCEMVADTMEHLRLNKERLLRLPAGLQWWSNDGSPGFGFLADGQQLVGYANRLIAAYEAGQIFDFLRGAELPARTAGMV